MSIPAPYPLNPKFLLPVIQHVFLPPKLPYRHASKRRDRKINVELCNSLIEAAQNFLKILPSSESPLWMHMIKMIEMARCVAKAPLKKANLQRMLSNMAIGGTYIACPPFHL
jgi:hypothetical protein